MAEPRCASNCKVFPNFFVIPKIGEGPPYFIGMSIFRVDSEQVLAANSNIQATIGKLQSEVELLHAQLQSLEGSWQGIAADSFQELVKRWRTTATTVENQLGEIGAALARAATQYNDIEQANLRLFI